jgi:hypothetical protein
MTQDKRDAVLQLYVTKEEKQRIEAHARSKGIPTAAYLRMLALADIGESVASYKRPEK